MNDQELRAAQITERLLEDRIIFLGTPIDDDAAHYLLAKLLFLLDRDSDQAISLYINSPGGSVVASFAILDAIDQSSAPIQTTCVGVASGTALLILAHGTKGQRFATPHSELQMTTLRVGNADKVYDDATRLELRRLEDLIVSKFAKDTRQPEDKLRLDLKHELFLDAYGAKKYGLIDEVIKI